MSCECLEARAGARNVHIFWLHLEGSSSGICCGGAADVMLDAYILDAALTLAEVTVEKKKSEKYHSHAQGMCSQVQGMVKVCELFKYVNNIT